MLNTIRRVLQNRANARAKRIRDARIRRVPFQTIDTAIVFPVIPFSELPEPCYMNTSDADLENFLRHAGLTHALETYLRAEHARTLAS